MSELLDAVRAGRVQDIPGLVKPLGAADRKTELASLKALRTEMRGWPWGQWRERRKTGYALLVAGAGCHTGAAATAAWIGAREIRAGLGLPHAELLDLLAERDPGWLGDVAHRLAGRASTARLDYPLIADLVRLAGCPVPTTDAFVHGWADAVPSHGRLLPALRTDPLVRTMVPRLFATAELPSPLGWYGDAEEPHHWPTALTVLAEEGVVERSLLVDSCVARLLRGGAPGDLGFFLNLLRRLALTAAEEREHLADWIGMAADGTSAVAGYAQGVLGRMALAGDLPVRSLADMSRSVLFRPEKKLVRAQLVLLGKVLRTDGGSADELLAVVAEAFGHEDTAVQERALKLVARHLSAAGAGSRAELALAAAALSPVHRERATEVFGEPPAEPDPVPYEEILPPVPVPARLAPAPADRAELVEEVVALIVSREEVATFERTLDGLVRHAYRDREALADALKDALAARWWLGTASDQDRDQRFSRIPRGVEVVAASICERVSVTALWNTRSRAAVRQSCAHTVLNGVTEARLWEAAHLLRTRPLPFLLATPTWETGALDPDVLVERLGEYQRLCATPAPVDFAQALLRVRRGSHPEAARAAAALGTPEGDRLAAWLSGEGTALPALDPAGEPRRPEADGPAGEGRRLLEAAAGRIGAVRERLAIHREFPPAFRWLGSPVRPTGRGCHHWGSGVHWPAVLPEDRETLAGWLLHEVAACARDDRRGGSWWLPVLAESGGPAGAVLHQAVAYGLGARHPDDRLSAVDALLVLTARGDLDGPLLGRELATLVTSEAVKANRPADALRTAAATGAYATVWSVLGAALPGLLAAEAARPRPAARARTVAARTVTTQPVAAGTVPAGTGTAKAPAAVRPGLGDLLAVAAECVEHCGARDAIPGLAESAGRGGSSRLASQAARLLAALRQGNDHSQPELAEDRPNGNRTILNPSVTNRS
ncbi:DUF6493 family protein [Streptomyces lushanensis]|uniref:DUF7824 domain-containing protein n=1 Tax=Streptomyces lushanensis TaxID=1434255 RepID=UPI000829BFC1|nr:DUF6493 family protein [Streptomyces lushanensis]